MVQESANVPTAWCGGGPVPSSGCLSAQNRLVYILRSGSDTTQCGTRRGDVTSPTYLRLVGCSSRLPVK